MDVDVRLFFVLIIFNHVSLLGFCFCSTLTTGFYSNPDSTSSKLFAFNSSVQLGTPGIILEI